jgi:hypothetical protein
VVVKCTKKSIIPLLVISECHRAHIFARYCVSLFTLEEVNNFLPLVYHSHAQSSTHESDKECASEGILSDVLQDNENLNEEDCDVDKEDVDTEDMDEEEDVDKYVDEEEQ